MPNDTVDLNQLLTDCRAIRPDVKYVKIEQFCGDTILTEDYWAHTDRKAYGGVNNVDGLLKELRFSVDEEAA